MDSQSMFCQITDVMKDHQFPQSSCKMMYFFKGSRVQNELFLCLGVGGGEVGLQEMSILGLGGKNCEQTNFDIKIQPKTIDLSMRLWGINTDVVGFISLSPIIEVYFLRLKFNISKLLYSSLNFRQEALKFCQP